MSQEDKPQSSSDKEKHKQVNEGVSVSEEVTFKLERVKELLNKAKICIDLAKSVDSENSALYNHIQEKFFDKEDVLQHLYQTNMMMDKLIYLVVWALHMGHYEHEDFEELKGVKKNLTRVDSDFRKHQPKLELLDKEVKERVAREKRGKHIYG